MNLLNNFDKNIFKKNIRVRL
ncbi:hypothetical protein LCGC14_1726790, partial [marine sediment metagenome]